MEPTSDLLTSRQAAELLGVSTSSIKRWAEEGVLACAKTAGKHRRFTQLEIDRFRASASPHDARPADWVDMLVTAVDGQGVTGRLLEERARLGSWARVADQLGPVIGELGRRWARGDLSVVEEHLAAERLSRALARACEAIPLPLHPPNALLATAEGDEHTLGLSLVEITLRELGWRTLWLGRKVPTQELAQRLGSVQPRVHLLAVSASASSVNGRQLGAQVARLGAACADHDIALVLGGSGHWPEHPRHGHRLRSLEELGALAGGLAARARRQRSPRTTARRAPRQ